MLDGSIIDKGSADFAYTISNILTKQPEGSPPRKTRILTISPNLLEKNFRADKKCGGDCDDH